MSTLKEVSLADYYYGLLSNLNADIKLDLIAKLSQSLKKSEKEPVVSLESLFGAWKTEESAEELIAEIRASRVNNRKIEPL